VEQGVSSNSALFVKNEATVAVGTGEQDRVGVVEIAVFKAYTKFLDAQVYKKFGVPYAVFRLEAERGQRKLDDLKELEEYTRSQKAGLIGSVVVSDGFFPFRDGVDAAIKERGERDHGLRRPAPLQALGGGDAYKVHLLCRAASCGTPTYD
jgi:phosphoribosylaminoimidazolecarboxamide formyltransferase/IMP cyclohydrolase